MSESCDGVTFQELLATEMPHFKSAAKRLVCPEGSYFFDKGDEGDGLYVIESGIVEIVSSAKSGQRRVLATLGPGAIFGEMAVLDGQPRSAAAVAREETVVCFFSTSDALRLLEQSPRLLVALAREFSRRQREMTRQYVAEILEAERLTLVGRFAQSIVHDLKNPVNMIALAADLGTAEDTTTEDRAEARSIIGKQVDRLTNMVQELLEFSRGSHRDLKLVPTDYRGFVWQIIEDIRAEATERGAQIVCENEPPSTTLLLETQRLSHVFYNLVHNAIDFMPEGGVLTLRFTEAPGHVVTEIEDTGPGLAPEIAPHLFEPFATHGKHHGTGLGLSICKRIVEDHGGHITARSEPGRGAIFAFGLPHPLNFTPPRNGAEG